MPRRISNGVVGRNVLGAYFSSRNVLATIENNQDIELSPNGTGATRVNSNLRLSGSSAIVFDDPSEDNTISIESPELSSDYTLTLPTDIGTAGDVLTVDGSGNLSFTDLTIEVNNQSADTSTYYPLISTSDSGSISSVDTASSKLSFQPSSGTLTVDEVDAADGSFSNNVTISNDLTVTNNISADDITAATITETSSIVLKKDIDPLENSVQKICALNPVEFTRKSNGKREVGLIAEEVEKIIPELVETHNDNKSVSYSRLTAYLIDAIQKLHKDKHG